METPDGFKQMRPFGPFHELVGPLFMAKRDGNVVVGLRMEQRHANAVASMHGGMLLTLVDTALTLAAMRAAPKGQYAVTSTLTSDFIAPARLGDWVEAEAEVLRAGRSVIYLQCMVRAEGKLLLRSSASFQVVAPAT